MTFEKKKKFDRTKCSAVAQQLFNLADREMSIHGKLPWIARGTAEWSAWRSWRVLHGEPVAYWDKAERVTVPTLFPPDSLEDMQEVRPRFST